MTEARQTSEGPAGARSRARLPRDVPRAELRNAGGLHGPGREQAVRHPEHRRAALHQIDTTLEPVAESTQVTSFYRGESRGLFKVAEPLLVRQTKKHFETAAENLRALLEDHALFPVPSSRRIPGT